MAVLALFIETIDGIAYFCLSLSVAFFNFKRCLKQLIVLKYMLIQIRV